MHEISHLRLTLLLRGSKIFYVTAENFFEIVFDRNHYRAVVLNLFFIYLALFLNKITRFTPNTLNDAHLLKIQK